MIAYNQQVKHTIKLKHVSIDSFFTKEDANIDLKTVKSFGEEWDKFDQFNREELEKIGNDYFDIVPDGIVGNHVVALDVGCGSGRWSLYLAKKVGYIEAIDPSSSVLTAAQLLNKQSNVRVTQASTDNIPFPNNSFDFVFSLGVLHHIPDTQKALKNCIEKIKPGGYLLIYLYYNLDNRGIIYKALFHVSNSLRYFISKTPKALKHLICDLIAFTIYLSFSRIASVLKLLKMSLWESIPLSYYHDKSLNILRNDALDRFGTPLEKRFSKDSIRRILEKKGMIEIIFSNNAPFWHVIAKKPL